MRRLFQLLAFVCLCVSPAFGQGTSYVSTVTNTQGVAIAGATITVCTYSSGDYNASGAYTGAYPCSAPVAIYSDPALANPITPPLLSSGQGNFSFYVGSGAYTITITAPGRIVNQGYSVTLPCVPGSTNAGCGSSGTGCAVSGSSGQIIFSNGSSGCTNDSTLTYSTTAKNLSVPSIDTIVYIDGVKWSGATDIGATINSIIGTFPLVGGYASGKIIIPCGTYPLGTTVSVTSPYVSLEGSGSGCTVINSSVSGDAFQINLSSNFTVTQAGSLTGVTINGQQASTGANANGIHLYDIIGFEMHDVVINNFWGANSSCLWMADVNDFVERSVFEKVHLNYCTKGLRLTSAVPQGSFGYNKFLDMKINASGTGTVSGQTVTNAQTAISIETDAYLYNSVLNINANVINTNPTFLSLTGTAIAQDNFGDIAAEAAAGGVGASIASGANWRFSGDMVLLAFSNNSISGTYQTPIAPNAGMTPYYQTFDNSTGFGNFYYYNYAPPAVSRTLSINDPGADDYFVFGNATQGLSNKTAINQFTTEGTNPRFVLEPVDANTSARIWDVTNTGSLAQTRFYKQANGTDTTQNFLIFDANGDATFYGWTLFPSYLDILGISAPANPASGYGRVYFNTGTGMLACVTSGGANCLPSGGTGSSVTVNGSAALASPVNFQNGPTNNGVYVQAINPSASNVDFALNGTFTAGALPATTVYTGQANTFGAFLQDFSGSTIKIPASAGFTAGASSTLGIDTTGHNIHAYLNAADSIIPFGHGTGSWVNGDCAKIYVSGGQFGVDDNGAACGSGGSSIFTSYQFGSQTAITGTANYLQTTYPSEFTTTQTGSGTSGSPFIDAITNATETAHYFAVGPLSGSPAAWTFRAMDPTDVPTLNQSTTGSAASLAATSTCTTGQKSSGINTSGTAQDCTAKLGTAYGGTNQDSSASTGVPYVTAGTWGFSNTIPAAAIWNGTVIGSTYGGTGVNNGASTITLGGNLTFTGSYTAGFTLTGNTSVTLPTSGTLCTTATCLASYPGAGIPISTGSAWGSSLSETDGDLIAGVSGAWTKVTALPNGTTATTQTTGDNTTKVATDAFVNASITAAPYVPETLSSAALTGQTATAVNGSNFVAQSAGVGGRTASGTTDTILCDSGTTIRDRLTTVLYTSSTGSAITIPQAGSSGCGNNFTFAIAIGPSAVGNFVFTPTTSTIAYMNGSTGASAAPSLTLTPDQYCTFSSPDNTNYIARCVTGGGGGGGSQSGYTCVMSSATTCTATVPSTSNPICMSTLQSTGSVIASNCSVSGTTATVTAASSNSLTWGFAVFPGPSSGLAFQGSTSGTDQSGTFLTTLATSAFTTSAGDTLIVETRVANGGNNISNPTIGGGTGTCSTASGSDSGGLGAPEIELSTCTISGGNASTVVNCNFASNKDVSCVALRFSGGTGALDAAEASSAQCNTATTCNLGTNTFTTTHTTEAVVACMSYGNNTKDFSAGNIAGAAATLQQVSGTPGDTGCQYRILNSTVSGQNANLNINSSDSNLVTNLVSIY